MKQNHESTKWTVPREQVPASCVMDDHVLFSEMGTVPQSEADTTFVKVTLRSPFLIFLFSRGGEVAGAFVEKVFFLIFGRSRIFLSHASISRLNLCHQTVLKWPCTATPKSCLSFLLCCCSFSGIGIVIDVVTPPLTCTSALHSHMAIIVISTKRLLAIRLR